MRSILIAALLTAGLSQAALSWAAEKPLTLEAALEALDAPHPNMQIAQAELDLALAGQQIADSAQDVTLTYEGALQRGKMVMNGDQWEANNTSRLALRKNLLDFGREHGRVTAAQREADASRLALLDERDARRIDIMVRFFDVLLADAQYAADNEYMAVYYIGFDNAKNRHELGAMNSRDLAALEARYQDQREKRNHSLYQQRTTRKKLAGALNQPENLPGTLETPRLPQNNLLLPEYADLLPLAMRSNRKLLALQSKLDAVAARAQAIRADRAPTLDIELAAGDYSRDAITRDRYSGGLILNWPIYQGQRIDGQLARNHAVRVRAEAEIEKFKRELSTSLLETWLEIDWLKQTARSAAKAQTHYRDQAMERARAEYEMELTANIGTAMADTQAASVRNQRVEFQLALALTRLASLVGQPLTDFAQPKPAEKK